MAEVLVLVELNPADWGVRKTTLEALTAARALGEPSAVVAGVLGCSNGAKDVLAGYGAAKVYVAESPDIDDYLVAPKAEVLAQLVASKSPAAVVIPSSPEGKEAPGAPRPPPPPGGQGGRRPPRAEGRQRLPHRRHGDRRRRHRHPGGL